VSHIFTASRDTLRDSIDVGQVSAAILTTPPSITQFITWPNATDSRPQFSPPSLCHKAISHLPCLLIRPRPPLSRRTSQESAVDTKREMEHPGQDV